MLPPVNQYSANIWHLPYHRYAHQVLTDTRSCRPTLGWVSVYMSINMLADKWVNMTTKYQPIVLTNVTDTWSRVPKLHKILDSSCKVRWIRPLVTLELMSNYRKKRHFLRVIFKNIKNLLIRAYFLTWENSWRFATPPLASLRNDLWETSTETPYWWHVTTYIWVVPLTGWSKFPTGTTSQQHHPDLGSEASSVLNFCARYSDFIRRETSGDVTKCRLFSWATYFQEPLHLYYFNRHQYSQLKCLCGPLTIETTWRTPTEPLQLST